MYIKKIRTKSSSFLKLCIKRTKRTKRRNETYVNFLYIYTHNGLCFNSSQRHRGAGLFEKILKKITCTIMIRIIVFVKKLINDESRFHQIPTVSQHFLLFLNQAEFWEVQWINKKCYIMGNYVLIIFLRTFSYQLMYFADKVQKTDNFA